MESKPLTLASPAMAFWDAFAPALVLSDAMVSALGIN